MKLFTRIIPIVISGLWLFAMQTQFQIGGNDLPPLAKFFSPAFGFWKNVQHPDADCNKTISDLPVNGNVVFDDRMVPHIFASSIRDAYFIQGYVHAMHRLWQMDFSTRAAEGRISEIIGAKALDFDRNKRRKGLTESAKVSVENWKKFPEAFKTIQAYSDGFNAYLHTLSPSDLPIEYKLMNYSPELWSPYRSSLFHKSMSEILCGRESDVELSNAKLFFDKDFDLLFNEMDSLTDPVIPKGTKWNFTNDRTPNDSTFLMGYIDWIREPESSGIGSNNWAVSRAKSATGNPILCNDPHLMLTLPSIWYEQQIVTPDMNVYGVTFPGVPGVVIGFNKDISWGVTNAAWDVMDWYKIKWKDSGRSQYELDGKWMDTRQRIETIKIKGRADYIDTVLLTNWGPVVYEDEKNKKFGLAMHWIIQDNTNQFEIGTFADLDKAKNFIDYRTAIKQFPYPAQNFAFASVDGDIAMTVQGNMPVKTNQQGRFVMDGSDSKNAWHGFINNDNNPYCHNPERGFISSANQRSTDLSYPNYYNNGDFRDYRGTLINRLLAQKEKWTVDDMKALQYNSYSLKAETALPFMLQNLDALSLNGKSKEIYGQLKNWNFNYDSNRIEPVYFEFWFNTFHKMVWDEINMDSTKKAVAIPSDESTIEFMKTNPDHPYFDYKSTSKIEHAHELMNMAFDSLIQHCQSDLKVKDWAEYKDAGIAHLARIPAFGKPHVRTSGSKDIINAHGKTEGPSWRMIVELNKSKINAYGIYPGGQSGNPGSPYYMQMIEDWSKGKYYSLQFMTSLPEKSGSYQIMNFKN